MEPNCIFCKIISGEFSGFKVAENDKFIAFLDKFPIRRGQVWIASKQHLPSQFTKVDAEASQEIIAFAQELAKKIETKLPEVERCLLVWEGLGVDHMHVKLYPNKAEHMEHGITGSGPEAADADQAEVQKLLTE